MAAQTFLQVDVQSIKHDVHMHGYINAIIKFVMCVRYITLVIIIIIITAKFLDSASLAFDHKASINYNKPREDVAKRELLLRFEETCLENERTDTLKVVS